MGSFYVRLTYMYLYLRNKFLVAIEVNRTSLQFVKQQKKLVGGFNPSEKYARQIGHLPQIGLKIKHI